MNKQFKPGPAKLRNGLDARIYEQADGRIFGRFIYDDGNSHGHTWTENGRYFRDRDGDLDLMPNVEPVKVVFEDAYWDRMPERYAGHFMSLVVPFRELVQFEGKRTRVEVTVLDDDEDCIGPDHGCVKGGGQYKCSCGADES